MSLKTRKTVWILGSGFSKPLGGPLLRDLFRKEHKEDILPFFPEKTYPDLAESLPWVQTCFKNGHDIGLWENAERFLAYVDDGYLGGVTPKRERLVNLIRHSDPLTSEDLLELKAHSPAGYLKHRAYKKTLPNAFDRKVRRALAAECSQFLMVTDLKSELGLPYRNWVKTLRPGKDTVLCFNYDRVIETVAEVGGVAKSLWIAKPGEEQPPNTVPVLKLHGSVDWLLQDGPVVASEKKLVPHPVPNDILRDPDDQIGIAAPGGSKARFVRMHLDPLWTLAVTAMTEAEQLIVVGYSFPDTDPNAQYQLLQAFSDSQAPHRWVHIVLGPDITSASRRMLSLMRSTARDRTTKVLDFTEGASGGRSLNIVQHALGSQDFICRHESFTTIH